MALWLELIPKLHKSDHLDARYHQLDDWNNLTSFEAEGTRHTARSDLLTTTRSPRPALTTPSTAASTPSSSTTTTSTTMTSTTAAVGGVQLPASSRSTFVGQQQSADDPLSADVNTVSLSITIAVGSFLLFVNILVFVAVYYQKDRIRRERRRHKADLRAASSHERHDYQRHDDLRYDDLRAAMSHERHDDLRHDDLRAASSHERHDDLRAAASHHRHDDIDGIVARTDSLSSDVRSNLSLPYGYTSTDVVDYPPTAASRITRSNAHHHHQYPGGVTLPRLTSPPGVVDAPAYGTVRSRAVPRWSATSDQVDLATTTTSGLHTYSDCTGHNGGLVQKCPVSTAAGPAVGVHDFTSVGDDVTFDDSRKPSTVV